MRRVTIVLGFVLGLTALPPAGASAPEPAWVTQIRDVRSGESVFWTDVHGEFAEPVAIVDGVVVARWSGTVVAADGVEGGRALLAGVDVATGERVWSVGFDSYIGWPAIAADGSIVVDTEGARTLIALDPRTGEQVWSRSVNVVDRLVAAGDGVVIAGRRTLEGIGVEDDATRWVLDARVDDLIISPEGVWAFVAGERRLGLLDPATGEAVRSVVLPIGTADVQAIVGDVGYVTGWPPQQWWGDGAVAAVDLADGSLRWSRDLVPADCRGGDGCITRGIHLTTQGGVVAAKTWVERSREEPCPIGCPFDRTISVLDAVTGEVGWEVVLGEDWEGGPGVTIAGPWLVATDDRLVTYAIDDGTQGWAIPAPASPEGVGAGERFSGAAVVSDDGRLVVGTWGGALLAYDLPGWTPSPSVSPSLEPSLAPSSEPGASSGAAPAGGGGGSGSEGAPFVVIGVVLAAIVAVAVLVRRKAVEDGSLDSGAHA